MNMSISERGSADDARARWRRVHRMLMARAQCEAVCGLHLPLVSQLPVVVPAASPSLSPDAPCPAGASRIALRRALGNVEYSRACMTGRGGCMEEKGVETHMRAFRLCANESGRIADRGGGHRAARVEAPWLDMTRAAICCCASASMALSWLCCLLDALPATDERTVIVLENLRRPMYWCPKDSACCPVPKMTDPVMAVRGLNANAICRSGVQQHHACGVSQGVSHRF